MIVHHCPQNNTFHVLVQQSKGQRAPSNPDERGLSGPHIFAWAGMCAETRAKSNILLHASILTTLCALCEIKFLMDAVLGTSQWHAGKGLMGPGLSQLYYAH